MGQRLVITQSRSLLRHRQDLHQRQLTETYSRIDQFSFDEEEHQVAYLPVINHQKTRGMYQIHKVLIVRAGLMKLQIRCIPEGTSVGSEQVC